MSDEYAKAAIRMAEAEAEAILTATRLVGTVTMRRLRDEARAPSGNAEMDAAKRECYDALDAFVAMYEARKGAIDAR